MHWNCLEIFNIKCLFNTIDITSKAQMRPPFYRRSSGEEKHVGEDTTICGGDAR